MLIMNWKILYLSGLLCQYRDYQGCSPVFSGLGALNAEILESLGHVARILNPQWKFGTPAADYVEGTATLASLMYYQVVYYPVNPVV